jgi:DNA repair exonuclease SbcCD nuclease subunit
MAREIRIFHTADTHLGYSQYYSEVRRKDFFKAFEIVINDAIDMQVDAVVHAGDLFDSRNPTLEDLLETINILFKLKAVGIPFFGIVGNHESKQNKQWLDLFEKMELATRLGKKPLILRGAAIYGIDSVPRSKIPLFDYSGFEAPDSSLSENCKKLLVMHQIMQPFPYAEWDCVEVLNKLPFKIDAILLGDYHKYEKIKVEDTWVTYSGSTERNSTAEEESRSYNIITLSDERLEISRRTIPTRKFLFIVAELNEEEKTYEHIFSAVNEHLEELPESVVFLEVNGNSRMVLSFSEIEEYLLNKGALVTKVTDLRIKKSLPKEVLKVTFSDPDQAVAEEIQKMTLNDGGLIVDEVVRNPNVTRSRVDEETESRISKLIEAIDFKDSDFQIESSVKSVRFTESKKAKECVYDDEIKLVVNPNPAEKAEFDAAIIVNSKTTENSGITEEFEILKPLDRIKSSEIKSAGSSILSMKSSGSAPETSSVSESTLESICEPAYNFAFLQESPKTLAENHGKRMAFCKDGGKGLEKEVEIFPDSEGEVSFGKAAEGNTEELSEGKPIKVLGAVGKKANSRQKKGNGKLSALRQYNLGDYL